MCYMIVKNTSSPPDAPRSPARAPGGHRLPPGVLSCRWPASSPHAFVTCLLSRQAAAYNSRCSTRWLSSPDRTLPRRPQLPARRRRPRFILHRFFRLFRQLHRDFFFLPAGEALGVSGVRHSGGPALGCLLHAIVRTAKCVREMRFYTSTCSFKNTVTKHPFLSCLRIGPSYPTPPWLLAPGALAGSGHLLSMRPKPSPFASRSVSLAGPGGVLRAIAPTHGGSRGALVRAGCAPLSLDPPGRNRAGPSRRDSRHLGRPGPSFPPARGFRISRFNHR